MPLQPRPLGAALNEELTLHSTLCRREAGAFQKAIQSGDDVVVACTQEKHLFAELAGMAEGGNISPLKFVNIRETGGWGRDAAQAMPKIAALLAAAHLPEPEPVPTVTYKSAGRLLIVGPLEAAEQAAALLTDVLDVTIFSTGGAGAQARQFPVLAGQVEALDGWLGAFTFTWSRNNPINLDLCTRCNACVAACPEGAIGLDYQVDMAQCQSHRACVKVCNAAGAIDFTRDPTSETEQFDLVLDIGAVPLITRHAPPQGYFRWDGQSMPTLLRLRDMVGEFDKPKFFDYKQKLCAHSRNTQIGCNACIDICSAEAVKSDKGRQQIVVNPNLCVGCGACTTVCPTGALTYAYPRASHQGVKLKTLLATYGKAGGQSAVLLLHSGLEYPLWYGPFALAFGIALGILWPGVAPEAAAGPSEANFKPNQQSASVKSGVSALILVAFIGWVAWDYWRVSQVYLPSDSRHPAYQADTLAKVRNTWWFRDPVQFAELTLTPLTRANAAQVAQQADALLSYSPEVRVIEKRIEAAALLGDDAEALRHMARYRAAFPEAYAKWARGNVLLPRLLEQLAPASR